MKARHLEKELDHAHETIHELAGELVDSNRGVIAITVEAQDELGQAQKTIRELAEELVDSNRGAIALTLEIEEHREEAAKLLNHLHEAEKFATMGELVAGIAHELNNPLATVSIRTEQLAANLANDERASRALAVIAQEVDRMGNLVKNLLEFSRRGEVQKSSIHIHTEIEKSIGLIEYRLRSRKIEIRRKFGSDIPLIIADAQKLCQVLLNLFSNAIDATPAGGSVTVATYLASPTPDNGPRVVIDISDTGSGIEPEHIERVMEQYFTTKPSGKGTGLGLPICRRIIEEEHQGKMEIFSEVGQGATIHIEMPTNGSLRTGPGKDDA